MDKEIIISRDKKNPTWAWVGCSLDDVKSKKYKRIIIDIFNDGSVLSVALGDEIAYQKNSKYKTYNYAYYEIIEEPKYRPFKDNEEFCNWLRETGRTDMRICNKYNKNTFYTISSFGLDDDCHFDNDVWFDDLSPIGIKE